MNYRESRQEGRKKPHRQDREALQRRDQILKRVPQHVTVFSILLVDDPSFAEPVFKLVSNIADKDPGGKIPGLGCSGGGLEGDEFNHPERGLIREILEETALTVSLNNVFNVAYSKGKLIYRSVRDPKRIATDTEFEFDWGQKTVKLPRLRNPKEWRLECTNPLFFYVAIPKWIDTPQQRLFQRLEQQLLAAGRSAKGIRRNGLFYDFLYQGSRFSGQETDALNITHRDLGITAEGQEEVDGLALFPLSRIQHEFKYPSKERGERGYRYYDHFHTISTYGSCILTWYNWLKEQLVREAQAAIESAVGLPDDKLPLIDRIEQALVPYAGQRINVPELSDAIAELCHAVDMRNPIDRLDFWDWFQAHKDKPESCPAKLHLPPDKKVNLFSTTE